MSNCHSEKCPVCNGTGLVGESYPNYGSSTGGFYTQKTCHGCHGKGWITVWDDIPFNTSHIQGEMHPDILNHITYIDSNLED